jgi:hypothetical protein
VEEDLYRDEEVEVGVDELIIAMAPTLIKRE